MKTSMIGVNMIKKYEGFRPCAYKALPSEKYYTIGYGHYSKDVKEGMTISANEAEDILIKDLAWVEDAVNKQMGTIPQPCFDALASFTFNCGPGNLQRLCRGRSLEIIAKKILLYDKAGGKTIPGLTRRRKEEQQLFLSGISNKKENVKKLQKLLNELGTVPELTIDGIIGNKTKEAFKSIMGVSL